jgi:hypothetical protein
MIVGISDLNALHFDLNATRKFEMLTIIKRAAKVIVEVKM